MVDLMEIGAVLRTIRGCRAAVMVNHARWIIGVQILRSSAVLALVKCVIASGDVLVNV